MRLLEENRATVMKKQLALLHAATCAFYHGSATSMQVLSALYALKMRIDCCRPL